MELRSYQAEAVERAFACWAAGKRSTLFVCPTGGGKTLVFAEIVRRHLEAGGRRVLVVADREWLITQAWDAVAAQADVEVGIEMNVQRVDRTSLPHVVCASIQSLVHRFHDFDADAFDLIVIDEADLALAPSYRRVVDYFVGARIFGCTATPDRGDGVALGDMFEDTCGDIDIRDLIDAGYLCTVRQHTVRVLDLSRVKMVDGDLDEASLERILTEERHLHEVVKPVLELAGDRPTLVFGMTVRHAELLAALFNRYRPGCARSIHGKTKKDVQRALVRSFVAREFQFLCNCNLVMRGVDIPPISCVAMARPTQSRTIYVQGLGRGTRMSSGKSDLLVLDFTDNATTFSLVDAVDVLGGRVTAEERERAREIVDEQPGADVSLALAQAREDLKDASIRARVLANVKFKTWEVIIYEPIDWLKQPLGKVPDHVIAASLGLSKTTVGQMRKKFGIKSFRDSIDWSSQPIDSETDDAIGKKLGVSAQAVHYQRLKRLGLKPKARISIDWSSLPLGKEPDRSISLRIGVTGSTVSAARTRFGIPPYPHSKGRKLNIDWDAQPLGKMSDRELGKRLGVDWKTVGSKRQARKIPMFEPDLFGEYRELLGKVPDPAIAKKLGVKRSTVTLARNKLGISAFDRKLKIDWDTLSLGKKTDSSIALELGISPSKVGMERKKRGIPPFLYR